MSSKTQGDVYALPACWAVFVTSLAAFALLCLRA
jgi:hypothetical protein